MAVVDRRRLLAIALNIYQRSRRQRINRIQKVLSLLLFTESRRMILIQQHLNLLRNLLATHHFMKRKEQRKPRSCRRFLRNQGWWETVKDTYDDSRFYETFRMTRATFYYILSKISDQIQKKFVTEEPILPDFRLAITIFRLSRGDYLFTIGEMCGLQKSTACMIVNESCRVIINTYWDESVKKHFPTSEDEIQHVMGKFGEEWQFPCAFAAVDGSHLPVKCPNGGAQAMKQYFNFKGFYSIVLMALVDAEYRFIWASVGAPGNTHDSTLLQSTDLWRKIVEGDFIPNVAQKIEDVEIPPLILGDGAFPLRTFLMKPHGDAVLPDNKRYFNFRHSRARLVTEGAFGRLKSRFRVLYRKCECNKETVKLYGLACVVLHNICIERGDLVPRKFDLTLDHASNKRLSPEEVRNVLVLRNTNQKNFEVNKKSKAEKVRKVLTAEMWKEKEDSV